MHTDKPTDSRSSIFGWARGCLLCVALGFSSLLLQACVSSANEATRVSDASGGASKRVTFLFTNDLESAYDPTEAFWRDDMARIGGVAELATLVEQYRASEDNVFLFDAGDIFTGSLAKLTQGEIAFELMRVMGYDAMGIGNHEFEFGWEEFARQKARATFPVLGANLTYKDSGEAYSQSHTVIERGGVRVGVIGVMGQDAATALIPSNLAGVTVSDPVAAVRAQVGELRSRVDLIVVLTHQGPTAPMQTNDEAVPEVYRGNAENLALAASVPGIDVIFAGHTDAGTPKALRDPVNGTLIMQTWGQGQHLGVLQLELAAEPNGAGFLKPSSSFSDSGVRSELVPVNSDALAPAPAVKAMLERYRADHPELFIAAGELAGAATRSYYTESTLGNLLADFVASHADADIGLIPSGALRKDLPAGPIRRVDVQDMFPFKDRVAVVVLSGDVLMAIIEQGLSLERGLLQVSGLEVNYDPKARPGERLVGLSAGGQPVDRDGLYRVATLEILAKGGDSYQQFLAADTVDLKDTAFIDALLGYLDAKSRGGRAVAVPALGRYSVKTSR